MAMRRNPRLTPRAMRCRPAAARESGEAQGDVLASDCSSSLTAGDGENPGSCPCAGFRRGGIQHHLVPVRIGMLVPIRDAEFFHFHVIEGTGNIEVVELVLDAKRSDHLENAGGLCFTVAAGKDDDRQRNL